MTKANGRLFYAYGHLFTTSGFGGGYTLVPWERDSDPTERIMASTLAGQYSYQITGPGDLEEPDKLKEHNPGTKDKAQAMARYALTRAAARRGEQYARDADLPEVVEGPYQDDEPWYDADEYDEYSDEYSSEYADGDSFAPTVDQAVQADAERHGIHPDLRWDSVGPEFLGEDDRLADLRIAYRATHKWNNIITWHVGLFNMAKMKVVSRPYWNKAALIQMGSRAKEERLSSLYKLDKDGEWKVRRDSEATRHMARGAMARNARYMGFLGIIRDVDLACQSAVKAGKGSREAALARQGLAWVVMLWGQHVIARAVGDQKRLANVCPVLRASQLYLTWDQRKALDSRRTALLTKWARITGLSRQEANLYHSNVVAPGKVNEYRGANVDYSIRRRSDSVTRPMGTKASMMPLQWYPRRKPTEPVKIRIKGFHAYLSMLARLDVFQRA